MQFLPADILQRLLEVQPRPTSEAPRNARGLYGLIDHNGDLRYIGSTSSPTQNLYDRIHLKHRTGSEGMSHYFSHMYNSGRMWRLRNDPATKADGDLAKKLRNEFVKDHCRAIWLPLPDDANIAQLEADILAIAPEHAVSWNRRKASVYAEPVDLVDATLARLGWGRQQIASIERQRDRFLAISTNCSPSVVHLQAATLHTLAAFPEGPFRFMALDVETANNDRATICQIGVACVRPDNSIETWTTYVDPQVDQWVFTGLHGISAVTVKDAPTFPEVLKLLDAALGGYKVYQHSTFDQTAIAAACARTSLCVPSWEWCDSVQVARNAWPELRGNGGHGLANLKDFLGLTFKHHDAGEDARASAEVVLLAERQTVRRVGKSIGAPMPLANPIETISRGESVAQATRSTTRVIGKSEITQGNISNSHIYLRSFIDAFPADAIGGSNRGSAASREVSVDWGGHYAITTDIDGSKMLFRSRSWIREFFDRNSARAGDMVTVEEIGAYNYRVRLEKHRR